MVLYICDCKKPCAAGIGCHRSGSDFGLCSYTTDPEHALYGSCADPQNHPERFGRVFSDETDAWNGDYYEKEVQK